jgi:hypothetical protein
LTMIRDLPNEIDLFTPLGVTDSWILRSHQDSLAEKAGLQT